MHRVRHDSCELALDVRYDVHHVAVSLDEELVGDLDGTDGGDAADIVAAKVEQHQMLGALLRIGEQFLFQCLVLVRCCAAMTRAGNWTDRDNIVGNLHQNFRTRSRDCEAAKVQKIEIGGRIGSPKRAIERERRQGERRLEALCQHNLEGIASDDVLLRLAHHGLEFFGRRIRFCRNVDRPVVIFRLRFVRRDGRGFRPRGQVVQRLVRVPPLRQRLFRAAPA